jgi:hypothetical protein
MTEGAFEFRVMDPEQRKGGGTLDLAYWVYKVRARTTLPVYVRKDMEVVRRYSDFEWLRNQLAEEYVFCIIPPIPEKAVQGALEKFVSGAHDPRLLEYRQRALRKFLIRVGAHPTLYSSQLLQDFLEMDEGEWERRMKAPKKPGQNIADRSIAAAIGDGVGNALSKAQGQGVAPGASYVKALSESKSSTAVWDETRAYISQLESSIALLRERLEQLVKRRKETSSALTEFGKAFTRVGEIEAAIEASSLSSALTAVGQHSGQLAIIYLEHGDQETKQVVETLSYYIGMCAAVRETLKRLLSYMSARDSLVHQVQDLQQQQERAVAKGGQAEKVSKLDHELQQTTQRRDQAIRDAANVEQLFREELRRFHREKQYDIKAILKIFTELQLDYAAKMKRSWENLLPTVEQIKL